MAKKTFFKLIGDKVKQITKAITTYTKSINISPLKNEMSAPKRSRVVKDEVKELVPELTKSDTGFINENTYKGKTADDIIANTKRLKEADYPNGESIAISNLESFLTDNVKEPYSSKLLSMLETAIDEDGRETVARRLDERSEEITTCMNMLGTGSDKPMLIASSKLASLIKGSSLSLSEAKEIDDIINDSYWDEGIDEV